MTQNKSPRCSCRSSINVWLYVSSGMPCRSLAACEQLSRAGYTELAWISGGLDTVRPGEMKTTADKDLRYAGIGGLSQVVGWTEVQQEESKDKDGSFGFVLKVVRERRHLHACSLGLFHGHGFKTAMRSVDFVHGLQCGTSPTGICEIGG